VTSDSQGAPISTAQPKTRPASNAVFATTHWSVVQTAGERETPESSQALEALCRAYWYPLYAYVRRAGHSPQDAEDLTQAFFARFLEKQWVVEADRNRGRFRSFLLSSLKHFLANEWDKARAEKRGGRVKFIPLNSDTAETRYRREPADTATPDREFDRRWALALLDTVLSRLQQEYADEGKSGLFDRLKGTLGGDRSGLPYARLGEQLQMSEGAVKVAVHRLRQRYRVILRSEIANTVSTSDEVEAELKELFAALAG
jgi:RNA polymerase sigma-70 factor (ECF subfamily)